MTRTSTLPPDYHCHTHLCKHAEGEPIDYARAALAKGITEIACTEHAPAPEPFTPGIRMALDEFPLYCEWVEAARALEGITVLLGIEADYYDGCEAFLEEWLDTHPFDYVLGSVHFLRYERERDHAVTPIWTGDDPASTWAAYFARIQLLVKTGLYDVVAHLDLPKRFGPAPDPQIVEAVVKPALDAIADAQMGIEINTSGFIHGPSEPYPSLSILTWANERGIPISFGSDSHQPERMGGHFEQAVKLAEMAGYQQRASYRQRQRVMHPLTEAPD